MNAKTLIIAAAALLLAKAWFGKADLTMALNGALAGLVSITADPLSPSPLLAMLIGAVGGVLVVGSIVFLDRKLKIDDPVGAISVHGTAGIWGVLAVLLSNGDATFSGQLIGLAVIFVYLFLVAQYESWLIPAAIVLSVPLALVGGVWLLYWLDFRMSVAVAVGFIALAGMAVEVGRAARAVAEHRSAAWVGQEQGRRGRRGADPVYGRGAARSGGTRSPGRSL